MDDVINLIFCCVFLSGSLGSKISVVLMIVDALYLFSSDGSKCFLLKIKNIQEWNSIVLCMMLVF